MLHIKKGKVEAGFSDLQIASKLEPEHPQVIYHLGLYYEAKRDFKQALDYYKTAKILGLEYHGIDLKIAEVEQVVEAFL